MTSPLDHEVEDSARRAAGAAIAPDGPSFGAVLSVEAMRCFLAIVDRGGVAGAAEQVGRSPAAVSMQLKKLEETLGAPLFERGPRAMRPTRHGERLIAHARKFLAAHAEALDAFRRPDLSGEVRLGLNGDVGPLRISEMLVSFAETHPLVQVSVVVSRSKALGAMLEEGALDLAILSPDSVGGARPNDMILTEDPLVWIGARGGRAHRRRPLPVALASSGCAWRASAVTALGKRGAEWRIAYVSDSSSATFAAAAADLAVAVGPRSAACCDARLVELDRREAGLPALGYSALAMRIAAHPTNPEATEALADGVAGVYERDRLR